MTLSPPSLKVELTAPDISAYRQSNVGIDYVTRLDSGKPGPHVIVQALTHGNEYCGAIALDWLLGNTRALIVAAESVAGLSAL